MKVRRNSQEVPRVLQRYSQTVNYGTHSLLFFLETFFFLRLFPGIFDVAVVILSTVVVSADLVKSLLQVIDQRVAFLPGLFMLAKGILTFWISLYRTDGQ